MATVMDYEGFKKKIKDKIGLDLGSYKEQQMKRRIHQLMQRYDTENYETFLGMLDRDRSILSHFTDYLTINTSQFFRDASVYRALETVILPDMLKKRDAKIWSAGCSIGAEPYSLAMLLSELAPGGGWRILATDFDVNILEKAKEGKYSENLLNNVPERFFKRYFSEQGGCFALDARIKQAVQFRRQNLLTDSYESGCNLILCRNVFIYFTTETQEQIISRFVHNLVSGGWFIIGCSEMIASPARFGLQKVQPAVYRKAD